MPTPETPLTPQAQPFVMPLSFGSLFAGIGGFDLGFERAGMVCKWQVEIDDYAKRVLAKHWPDVRRWDDVRTWPQPDTERVDVICGGFPCQDISYAGAGAGLDGERSGLFFDAVRVVRQLRPRFVVLENVAALLTRGLDRVVGTLAEIGYGCEWHCVPASHVGAPHIRDRVFIIGSLSDALRPECEPRPRRRRVREGDPTIREIPDAIGQHGDDGGHGAGTVRGKRSESPNVCRSEDNVADAECPQRGPQSESGNGRANGHDTRRQEETSRFRDGGEDVPDTARQLRDGAGRGAEQTGRRELAIGDWWDVEPDVGRVANGIPSRVDRLRGLGNAIVPQVAELIGRRIVEAVESAA